MAANITTSLAYQWFNQHIGQPNVMQMEAWQSIIKGEHALISAPTGTGKTLAAMLPLIEHLLTAVKPKTYVLYITPLKALSHDVQRNLQSILDGVSAYAGKASTLNVSVRTGDTDATVRRQQLSKPPQVIVTTPESLFILLSSKGGQKALSTIRYVVVDELHALVESKRGAHLMLSLQRLQKKLSRPLQRIAMSATQKPLALLGQWLTGGQPCHLVEASLKRDIDIRLALPVTPLAAILSNVQLEQIAGQIIDYAANRHTTLVFVNTRRLAERLSRLLNNLLKERSHGACIALGTHHGSLSRDVRLDIEQQLKSGQLNIVVATSSLELGIDIGSVDMVCQLGSPKRFAAMWQRAGRAGHYQGGVSVARLFPLTRDDLLEMYVMVQAMSEGELDQLHPNNAPLDVLAQHILAECASQQQTETELAEWVRKAWDYRYIEDSQLQQVLQMLADGFNGRQEQIRLLWNRATGRLQASSALSGLCAMNTGAIPDQFDQDVWLINEELGSPGTQHLGTVDEDFAFESMVGDVVQLGNRNLQIVRSVATGLYVRETDEHPSAIPFWLGEGAGRSNELSMAMGKLLNIADNYSIEEIKTEQWLQASFFESSQMAFSSQQLMDYLAACKAALGYLPHAKQIVIERFFDDTGNYHIVVHSTFGIAVNRAWGLALRKRFCRQFNFELQANATDNGLLLSLGSTHSFPLEEITGYLHSYSVRQVLIQALLDSPLFVNRWRWSCNIALAVLRMRNGKKVAPQIQRNQAEDLLALLFPDQLACLENIRGEREIPEHPLVQQVINDCLHEAMDIEGLEALLIGIESGDIKVHCIELNGPSPLAEELVHGKPWSFLDDGEAEDRRTRTISTKPQTPSIREASKLQGLPDADILRHKQHCWPTVIDPQSLYQLLCKAGYLNISEAKRGAPEGISNSAAKNWPAWFEALRRNYQATVLYVDEQPVCWVADVYRQHIETICPEFIAKPTLPVYTPTSEILSVETALEMLLMARLSVLSLTNQEQILQGLVVPDKLLLSSLMNLQIRGDIIAFQGNKKSLRQWAVRQHMAALRRS